MSTIKNRLQIYFFQNNIKLPTISLTEISKYPETYFLFCMEVYIFVSVELKKKMRLVKLHETRMKKVQRGFSVAILADRRYNPQVVSSIRLKNMIQPRNKCKELTSEENRGNR